MTGQVHQAIREPLSPRPSPGSASQGCNEERGQISQDSAFSQTSRGVTACLSTAGTRTQWTVSPLHKSALPHPDSCLLTLFVLLENFNWEF